MCLFCYHGGANVLDLSFKAVDFIGEKGDQTKIASLLYKIASCSASKIGKSRPLQFMESRKMSNQAQQVVM